MGTGVPGSPPATPCGRESLVVTSGDKAPYGDGEGRCLATACGRLGEGILLHPPRGFCMFGYSHLPGLTFSGGVSQVSQRPAAARPLRSLCWGGERAAACGPSHALGNTTSWGWAPGAGGKGAQVTLPCLENMNLHIKVGVGPRPGHWVPQLWRQDLGAVQNGSGEGAGARSSCHRVSLGVHLGGRQQVRSLGDVEIC